MKCPVELNSTNGAPGSSKAAASRPNDLGPEEVVTKGGWDMKYTADGSYYTKKEGSENWIELEEGTTAFGGVSSSFGHSEFDLNASRKNSEMFNSVGDIFNPKPKSVAKETKTINDIVFSDTTGAFVVPVETSASVNKQIAAKQKEMNSKRRSFQ